MQGFFSDVVAAVTFVLMIAAVVKPAVGFFSEIKAAMKQVPTAIAEAEIDSMKQMAKMEKHIIGKMDTLKEELEKKISDSKEELEKKISDSKEELLAAIKARP